MYDDAMATDSMSLVHLHELDDDSSSTSSSRSARTMTTTASDDDSDSELSESLARPSAAVLVDDQQMPQAAVKTAQARRRARFRGRRPPPKPFDPYVELTGWRERALMPGARVDEDAWYTFAALVAGTAGVRADSLVRVVVAEQRRLFLAPALYAATARAREQLPRLAGADDDAYVLAAPLVREAFAKIAAAFVFYANFTGRSRSYPVSMRRAGAPLAQAGYRQLETATYDARTRRVTV